METDHYPSNPELFAWYARNNLNKWKQLKGRRVTHKIQGNGTIVAIDLVSNNQIDVRVEFRAGGHWIRLNPSKNEFISNFTNLDLPNRLELEILKEWEKAHKKLELAKKRQEKRQQREDEKKQKLELERQREINRQKQKQRDKQHRFRSLYPFIQASKRARSLQIKATIDLPNLNTRDIQLALNWYHGSEKSRIFSVSRFDKNMLIENYGHDWELGRVLSARAAEKAVMEFYQRHGHHVIDISMHQVTSASQDWPDYDLKINGLPFDVKNSRRSKQSPDNYVEHCVPSFKQSRQQRDVAIAGILSPYMRVSDILSDQNMPIDPGTSILFLGITDLNTLDKIKNEFETPNLLEIRLEQQNRRGHFLPAWMFDYPKFLYEQRDSALCQIAEQTVSEYTRWQEFNVNPIPICTMAGIDLKQMWNSDDLASWKWDFLTVILDLRKKHGLSLPYLF